MPLDRPAVAAIRSELLALRAEMRAAEARAAPLIERADPSCRDSARNLIHYLALRRRDLRELQLQLHALGMSSLGRAESHVLRSVDSILDLCDAAAGDARPTDGADGIDDAGGRALIEARTRATLGPGSAGRNARIMVTLPSEAAGDPALARRLVERGMDVARINGAHDDAPAWRAMIEHVRRAAEAAGRSIPIAIDLPGPKLRTGPLPLGPRVLKLRPLKDPLGRVIGPAPVILCRVADHDPRRDATLAVPARFVERLAVDDVIGLVDARGRRRELHVVAVGDGWAQAHAMRTTYIVTDTELRVGTSDLRAHPEQLPVREARFGVLPGDGIVLTRDPADARVPVREPGGRLARPGRIACLDPALFTAARPGQPISFDDGKFGGEIVDVTADHLVVRVIDCPAVGTRLAAGKGINVPETTLPSAVIGADDGPLLALASASADLVGVSFANRPEDLDQVVTRLEELGRCPPLILKIETRAGFAATAALLARALERPLSCVMIARGDLAVECGFERLAEVQEELLWLAEAAHLPVIWATQVLESLTKRGAPTRAEVTDAAMSERAECVMLNKGPYVELAITALDGIIHRMEHHQRKKIALLRPLSVAGLDEPVG